MDSLAHCHGMELSRALVGDTRDVVTSESDETMRTVAGYPQQHCSRWWRREIPTFILVAIIHAVVQGDVLKLAGRE